jgi:hypothetical protein
MKDGEMGGACSTHGRDEKCLNVCRRENDIRMTLREIGQEVAECIHRTQDRDQWRGLVKMAMKHRLL